MEGETEGRSLKVDRLWACLTRLQEQKDWLRPTFGGNCCWAVLMCSVIIIPSVVDDGTLLEFDYLHFTHYTLTTSFYTLDLHL